MSKTDKPKANKATLPPKKALKPKVFSFVGEDGVNYTLTPQQKLFAELFCSMSMNGVQAIIDSGYNVTGRNGINYKMAAVLASQNLKKLNISAYITTLLSRYGLDDDHIDKQMLGVVNQWADLGAKVRAADVLYKKRGSYASDKNADKFNEAIQEMADKLASKLP